MIPNYRHVRAVLSRYDWKKTSPEDIFRSYLPQAQNILQLKNLTQEAQDKLINHLLHFFKNYCVTAQMKKWSLDDFHTRYQTFLKSLHQEAELSVSRWRKDAEIRERRMQQVMGGSEYYRKLFD